jgi:hypothetical protein
MTTYYVAKDWELSILLCFIEHAHKLQVPTQSAKKFIPILLNN